LPRSGNNIGGTIRDFEVGNLSNAVVQRCNLFKCGIPLKRQGTGDSQNNNASSHHQRNDRISGFLIQPNPAPYGKSSSESLNTGVGEH